MSNIYPLFGTSLSGHTQEAAEVVAAENGRAQLVVLEDGQYLNILGHMEQTPWLSVGERVFISVASEGAVVLGRLAGRDTTPPPPVPFSVDETGRITLDAPKGLIIKVGDHARIELNERGKVRIEGKEVSGLARGRMTFRGVTIDLN